LKTHQIENEKHAVSKFYFGNTWMHTVSEQPRLTIPGLLSDTTYSFQIGAAGSKGQLVFTDIITKMVLQNSAAPAFFYFIVLPWSRFTDRNALAEAGFFIFGEWWFLGW
jgi:hypothetical protein